MRVLRVPAWFLIGGIVVATSCGKPARPVVPLAPQTSLDGDCELTILSQHTWDDYVPKGKEVDAIYGDFVLRNDKIVASIANPVPGRNANMTVKDVGGSIIDLTTRDRPGDQLGAYYPGARRYPYGLASVFAEGSGIGPMNDAVRGPTDGRVVIEARDGKLDKSGPDDEFRISGKLVGLVCVSPADKDRAEVRLTYTLRQGQDFIEIRSEFINSSDRSIDVLTVDDFRADRTFRTAAPGETDLVWFYDKWWGQAYGVVAPGLKMRLTGRPVEPRVIEFLSEGKPTATIEPNGKLDVVRHVFPAGDLISLKAQAAAADGLELVAQEMKLLDDRRHPLHFADVEVFLNDTFYGNTRPALDGTVRFELPASGVYTMKASLFGERIAETTVTLMPPVIERIDAELIHPVAHVVAEISDVDGRPIPCKVQFVGVEGTKNPFFFDQTGEHAVQNLYYSHDGRFTQPITPGTYDVLVSYGPEYNVAKLRIEAEAGQQVPLKATLQRVVQSPGWVSTDFHSHSSPSGDNVSSQLGRVLNLLCEHVEFAPCTEHNRLDTYVPHLKGLGVEHRMATCTGIELTHLPGAVNHQNAFPLVLKPRIQDNGGPLVDDDPAEQIKRLALWDNGSAKLVQSNHPDMGEMFFDRDGDGSPDGGFQGMLAYQDVIEVHPIHDVLDFSPLRFAMREILQPDLQTKVSTRYQYNNSIFNWLQLINQGVRLPGVVNTDAHYNFHGSGYLRNYVKCETDDPAEIDPMDIVRSSEAGHIVMTNGPYLEVTLYETIAASGGVNSRRNENPRRQPDPRRAEPGGSPRAARRKAMPGDDIALPGGFASLHVRVQCPNWFDIDRVQVLLNGRPDTKFNWTRSDHPDAFSDGVVKFEREIPVEVTGDTHLIVVAGAEHSEIGPVMGPEYGKQRPAAISNPIFVDVDGGGFQANGDTLGHPLPVKQQKPVPGPPKSPRTKQFLFDAPSVLGPKWLPVVPPP